MDFDHISSTIALMHKNPRENDTLLKLGEVVTGAGIATLFGSVPFWFVFGDGNAIETPQTDLHSEILGITDGAGLLFIALGITMMGYFSPPKHPRRY